MLADARLVDALRLAVVRVVVLVPLRLAVVLVLLAVVLAIRLVVLLRLAVVAICVAALLLLLLLSSFFIVKNVFVAIEFLNSLVNVCFRFYCASAHSQHLIVLEKTTYHFKENDVLF